MDKHKKFKRPKHAAASLDGIISDGRALGVPVHRSYHPSQGRPTPSLDTFIKRSDGFHPMRQSPHSLGHSPAAEATAEVLDEPIVLDDTDHRTEARPKKRHSKKRKILKRLSLALLVLLLIGGGYFGAKLYITKNQLFRGGGKSPALSKCAELSELKQEGDCRVNILLLGTGGENHSGADLTDTIMLVSIDPINHKATLLSIPRDLWVRIKDNGTERINAAYAYGKNKSKAKDEAGKQRDGIQLVDDTLEPILGVPIHYHTVLNFTGFEQAVNAVGGVTVNVPKQLYDPTIAWENNRNPVIAQPGSQTFNGKKALLYVKSRQTSSDFERGERQRLVLVALKDKVLSVGTFSNPVKISQLLSSLGNNIYTDFELSDMGSLYDAMSKIPSNDITSVDLVTPPNDLLTSGDIPGKSTLVPKEGRFEYSAIQNFVRNALRDSFITKENSSIAVYNATSSEGLAAKKAAELKSFGYNITKVDNAQITNPATTIIVDLTKGSHKYTRHYLETRFGVTSHGSLPAGTGITAPEGTNFVIILGEDVANPG